MKLLVTGTNGFIGSHFFSVADLADHRVIPWSLFKINTVDNFDAIIHFASGSEVAESIKDPVHFIKNNVNITLEVMEAARQLNVKHVVQISTSEVFGPITEGSHDEYGPINPLTPYSASKAAQEAIAAAYWRTYGVPVTILSTQNVFGQFQKSTKFVPLVIRKLLKDEPVTIHSEGEEGTKRTYIHARTLCDGILFALQPHTVIPYGVRHQPRRLNIVGEKEVSNLELAMMIAKIMGKKLQFKFEKPERPGHDQRYSISGQRMKNSGWKPIESLEQSLLKTVDWYVNNQEFLGL